MAKTRQVMKLNTCGKHFTVVFTLNNNRNPYHIYEHWFAYNKHGVWTEHKRCVEKYQSMEGVLYYLLGVREFKKDVFKEGES